MKTIRTIFCILVIILVISISSCGFLGPQEYVCEVEKVESVQIIRLDKYVEEEYRFDYTVLAQISDYVTFVNRVNNLTHSVNWGEPSQMYEQYVVIRIDYRNGDYDLIYPNAQCFNRSGESDYGFFFFDEEEFNALVSEYWTE